MNVRRVTSAAAVVISLIAAGTARADTVVNPFAGQWNTVLGGSTPGTVKFSAIDSTTGANSVQAIGGHPCGAPTTYYHGEYTDMPNASTTQTGTMTACIVTAGHLVGRWSGGGDEGDVDVTLNTAQNGFAGNFTSDSFGVTFTYTGTFVAHFPGDGCCVTTPPPPQNNGWVIGGGIGLQPPATFCTTHFAGDASTLEPPAQPVCVTTVLLRNQQKAEALQELRDRLYGGAIACEIAHAIAETRMKGYFLIGQYYDLLCTSIAQSIVQAYHLWKDPADRRYGTPPGRGAPTATAAAVSSIPCPSGLTPAQCRTLRSTTANYLLAQSLVTKVDSYIAIGANRVTGAVKANSPFAAFFQEAFAKVNEGALATDVAAEHFYGQQLVKLLHADHLDRTYTVKRAKADLSRDSKLLPKSVHDLFVGQLHLIGGTVRTAALGASISASTFSAEYKAITITDLAAIVNGLVSNRDFSVAVGRTLAADLTSAQNNCANSSRRIAAIKRFIAYARAKAQSDAGFLSLGAKPLLASKVPASSCG
jgi:hypothetical protein